MKKIILIIAIILVQTKVFSTPPIDTLLLLQTRIENNKTHFINKPFKVLTDTLKKLKIPIIEYSGPHDAYTAGYINDTIWVSNFYLYCEKYLSSAKASYHDSIYFANKGKDTSNTHIKQIRVWFKTPIPYLRAWRYLVDENSLERIDGVKWNKKLATLYKDAIIKDIKVDEY